MGARDRASRKRRAVVASAVLAIVAVAFLGATVSPGFAQDRPRSLFELLFSPKKPREVEAPAKQPRPTIKRKTPVRAKAEPSAPPPPEVAAKKDDARVVLVVGDFLAAGLAEGLAAAYAEAPNVRVVEKANGSSGLVRDDHFDWPGEIGALIDAQKPAVVVLMLGANDRQEMRIDGVREPKRSDNWMKEYERRAADLAKAVTSRKVPLVWVGMPSFRNATMTSDMLAYNDVFRSASEAAGGSFVDIWDGFVDENGAFVASGPDINGNPVRLRSGDNGINLTRPAKRKVAFYAEKPLEKLLGPSKPAESVPVGLSGAAPRPADAAPAAVDIERTAPISLSDPELDGGQELLGATFAPGVATPRTAAEKLSTTGIAPAPVAGRADDFGDAVLPKASVELPPAAAEKTTAIAN